MLGKIEGGRRRGQQRMRWLEGITDSMDMSLSNSRSWWWTGRPGVLQSIGWQRVRHDWATELNGTELALQGENYNPAANLLLLLKKKMSGPEKWMRGQRIDAFELWCWRRLFRVPWTERRSNQSILKEISPEYSLEGLMLKLNFQYFGHLMWRTASLVKTLMLGKIEGRCRRGRQRMRWLDGMIDSMDMS